MHATLQLILLPDTGLCRWDQVTLYFHNKRTLIEEWRPHNSQVENNAINKGLDQVGNWSRP